MQQPAFLAPSVAGTSYAAVSPPAGAAQALPAAEGIGATSPGTATSALGAAAMIAVAGALGAAGSRRTVARQATAVKKKGVRVVEGREIPWNLFSPKKPYKATCTSNETITTRTSLVNWETCHTIIDHGGNFPYLEGQSAGVIAPGPDKKGEKPAKIRLYSIASSAVGDDETSKTVSLCVKRVVEVAGKGWCEYSNVEAGTDPEYPDAEKVYRGVCSSFICDLKAGDEVLLTGPTGAEMLLPADPSDNIIMLATGTGIAPMRSFLRYLFNDKVAKGRFQGFAWLFLGVPFTNSILYDDEWQKMKEEYPGQFRYDYAISDEDKRPDGGSMYVQHRMMEHVDEIWPLVKEGKTHIYMCGLKGMATGVEEAFGPLAEKEGIVIKDYLKEMKKKGLYHVEVY